MGKRAGDRAAARRAFQELAVVAGDALASACSLVDGLVVIGGGLCQAHALFLRRLVREMNASLDTPEGRAVARFESGAYDLEDSVELASFLRGDVREVTVPGSSRSVRYDAAKLVGVGLTRLGTSRAVSVGAYTLALSRIDAG
jgi:glucokinase